MKIREIRCAGLTGGTPAGGWSNELQPEDCVHTLVAVHTDEGVVGIGSVFNGEGVVRSALDLLKPLYQGENALEPERVSEKLHQHMFWLGRGGPVTHAISGIDIALWDILGKVTGQPVGRLLGGRCRSRIQPYASLLMDEPVALGKHLEQVRNLGFKAFKIGWGPFGRKSPAMDRQIVAAARSAVGAEARLMVDAGGSDAYWRGDYKWALATAHMLAEFGVEWFEEALCPDALDDYAKLREHSPVPISGGEVLTRRQAFVPWLTAHAFDIVQPDVTKVGGISEERRIAWMANDLGIKMIPHGWNTAVGLAADLQLASALPTTDLVEYLSGSPFIDEILTERPKLDSDGMLAIPETPGLGLELEPERVAHYTRGARLFD